MRWFGCASDTNTVGTSVAYQGDLCGHRCRPGDADAGLLRAGEVARPLIPSRRMRLCVSGASGRFAPGVHDEGDHFVGELSGDRVVLIPFVVAERVAARDDVLVTFVDGVS